MAKPPKAARGKPGRPRIVDDSFASHLGERARNNHYHAIYALNWLGIYNPVSKRFRINAPAQRYLLPLGDRLRRAKWDVLAQLGRVKSALAVRIFADRICELKPPAKQAVTLIRDWHRTFEWLLVFDIESGDYDKIIRQARAMSAADVPPKLKRKVAALIASAAHMACDGRPIPELLERPADWRLAGVRADTREKMRRIEVVSSV
jgi:hypothetical protein